jgi:2-amino-4-hydroxy-6-hydroxymethyldihydropteridine diphosphokinase
MPVETVHIGIGSNIGDSITIVNEAIAALGKLPKTEMVAHSKLYCSEAVSEIEQDDYINAVAKINTSLEPIDLLLELQAIEQAFYRQRDATKKWAPRTLDLDIILFGIRKVSDSHLTIPHAELQNRLFVLKPMFEISGDLYITGLGSLEYLIENAPDIAIQPI